jgi:hypothetical protein
MNSKQESLYRNEVKDNPVPSEETKIVEAYGLGKCPKLVRQIAGVNLDVRIKALAVLCNEFNNPYSIEGCAREGAIKVLANMVSDPDFTTRIRATRALALAAIDANGIAFILSDDAVPLILGGIDDPSETVRENVYECLLYVTRTPAGIASCVQHGVVRAIANVLSRELEQLKASLLKVVHNIVGAEDGLVQALECNVVGLCISLLQHIAETISNTNDLSTENSRTLEESARTLGFLCFDGRAKVEALEKGAVAELVRLLKFKKLSSDCKSSVSIALMAITITDDGKKQVFDHDGVDAVISLLYDDSRVVVLNTLKIISNLAIYPQNRQILVTDSTCVVKLRKLSKLDDSQIAKHAGIALTATTWNP